MLILVDIYTHLQVWPYRIASVRYARGIAYAITGDVEKAREEYVLFEAAAANVPSTYTLHNNSCIDMLNVARAMLIGEIEYRAGKISPNSNSIL